MRDSRQDFALHGASQRDRSVIYERVCEGFEKVCETLETYEEIETCGTKKPLKLLLKPFERGVENAHSFANFILD